MCSEEKYNGLWNGRNPRMQNKCGWFIAEHGLRRECNEKIEMGKIILVENAQ